MWEEFEQSETAEAKFAHVMDNIQPIMLNDNTNGKSWREHNVALSQMHTRNKKTHEGSQILWDYVYKNIVMPNIEKGNIIDDLKK